MTIESIELWHKRARPNPTDRDFNVQLGCHLEEVVEMIECLRGDERGDYLLTMAEETVRQLADALKTGEAKAILDEGLRKDFLDSLADQTVTAIGAGHCANMKTSEALRRVNTSNWSKFDDDGQPIRDANGKIAKGPSYAPPNLTGLFEGGKP